MSKENPFYKKLSYNITREGSKYPFRNDYTYKFSNGQFLEQIDDLSDMSSYTYNEIKQIAVDSLVEEFRTSLNSVVFGDPAGKEYVESLNQKEDERLSEGVDIPKPPKPPLSRIIREGTIGDCLKCHSTTIKRFIWFGRKIGCIQPKCENYYYKPKQR